MLTPFTQLAIAFLSAIESTTPCLGFPLEDSSPLVRSNLLSCLVSGGFIGLLPGAPVHLPTSYYLLRPLSGISLLELLEVIGENLNNNHLASEQFYSRYGSAAHKLGVINQMTRRFLSEIAVSELA